MELLLNKTNLSKRNVIKTNAGLSRCLYFLLRTTLRKKVKGQPSFHFNVSLRSQCNHTGIFLILLNKQKYSNSD